MCYWYLSPIHPSIQANQHQSIVHGVVHVLADIAPQFSLQQIESMFIKLSSVPLPQLDPKMCTLIRQLVYTMINRARISPRTSYAVIVVCYNPLKQSVYNDSFILLAFTDTLVSIRANVDVCDTCLRYIGLPMTGLR